jgi:protein-tyrosine phosphatase
MAQIVLADFFHKQGIDSTAVLVDSSGVSDEEYGNPIDRRARRVLLDRGYTLPEHHFAHRITHQEALESDLLLPMTAAHMRSLLRLLPAQKRQDVHMYRSFDPAVAKLGNVNESALDLADPWYGGPEEFELAIDQIEQAAPYIVDWVAKQL